MNRGSSREWRGPRRLVAAALLLSLAAGTCRGGGFERLAARLSRAAVRAEIRAVAVLPFEPADFSASREGVIIAERLTTCFVKEGRVRAAERRLLEGVFDEQRLARTGAVAPQTAQRLGALQGVGGIVTGTYAAKGRGLLLQARLIDVETGVIVAAAQAEVGRTLPAGPRPARRGGAGWLLPAFDAKPPVEFMEESMAEFLAQPQPGGGDGGCADAERAVADMEEQIIELKARDYALRMRKGEAGSGEEPGAELADPGLRRRFEEAVRAWAGRERVPALTAEEMVTFLVLDGKAKALSRKCERARGAHEDD